MIQFHFLKLVLNLVIFLAHDSLFLHDVTAFWVSLFLKGPQILCRMEHEKCACVCAYKYNYICVCVNLLFC